MSALARYPVPQATAAGKVDGPRLSFRLEPTIVPDPVLEFLQPQRGLESIKAGAVDDPRLYFRLTAAVAAGGLFMKQADLTGLNVGGPFFANPLG